MWLEGFVPNRCYKVLRPPSETLVWTLPRLEVREGIKKERTFSVLVPSFGAKRNPFSFHKLFMWLVQFYPDIACYCFTENYLIVVYVLLSLLLGCKPLWEHLLKNRLNVVFMYEHRAIQGQIPLKKCRGHLGRVCLLLPSLAPYIGTRDGIFRFLSLKNTNSIVSCSQSSTRPAQTLQTGNFGLQPKKYLDTQLFLCLPN